MPFRQTEADPDNAVRVLVFGPADFDNYELLCQKMDHYVSKLSRFVICCGSERTPKVSGKQFRVIGTDWLVQDWLLNHCRKPGRVLKRFSPDEVTYGSESKKVRDCEMLAYVTGRRPCYAVAFSDGKCKTTLARIEACRARDIRLKTVRV